MNRQEFIKELRNNTGEKWDIIIIGGGATGLGIALDGASRGYRTLLFEQSDFAKGTSSKSTKLVHGGVRYMAQGDLLLVKEALHERGLMLSNAPHLTRNQEFVIPVYTYWDAIKYTVGLKFYDLLAGRLSMGKSYFINHEKTIKRLPKLRSSGLIGGIVYHDGQFDDSRMALSLAKSCVDKGGLVLNYFEVTGLLKDKDGKIDGVLVRDIVSAEEIKINSRLVINATGVFADEIARMDDPELKPTLKPSQGVHIVLDKSFLQSNSAIMIPKTDDGRVLFAIPWYDKVVVGTTDTPVASISLEPVALESEINFILKTAELYFVKPPRREDILSIFAGLRPLAANPGNPSSTKEVSRRHKITLSASGLLTIIGGKWTTYRLMAQEAIDKAINSGIIDSKRCVTSNLRLSSISKSYANDRLQVYSEGAMEIEKLIRNNPISGIPIDPRLPFSKAEIVWICRNEMPVNIEDILARRTRALFLDAHASAAIAPEVARVMAEELGYSLEWQEAQVKSYNRLLKNYI